MGNGDCPVGAANAAHISALAKTVGSSFDYTKVVEDRTDKRLTKVESKQDWMIYLLIMNLVAIVVGYIQ